MSDWSSFPFTHDGVTRDVYAPPENSGKRGILVMHELAGITDETLAFARSLAVVEDGHPGFDVFLPAFFGRLRQRPGYPGVFKGVFQTMCVRAEFRAMQSDASSPIAGWLRALSRELAVQTGGPIGVVGMCLSGGVVFSMVWDPAVQAAVSAQPSLPFRMRPEKITVSTADFEAAANRVRLDHEREATQYSTDPGTPEVRTRLQVHHFSKDGICPAERVTALRERWVELAPPDSLDVVTYPGSHHATLTEHADHATADAGTSRRIVRAFFEEALT